MRSREFKVAFFSLMFPFASGVACQSIHVFSSPPTVLWSMGRVGADDSLTVAFTANGADPDGGEVRYLWDFKDGTIVTEQNPTHVFSTSGYRQITLSVTDDEGETTQETLTLTVPLSGPAVSGGERTVAFEGDDHVPVGTVVNYTANPPASGAHYSAPGIAPLAAGVYVEADGIRPEQWVHNLEHGYVVYLYECNGACITGFIAQLQALFNATPPGKYGTQKLVIAPYAGLGPAMMAVAWNVQQDFATVDAAGLTSFYQRHVDRGPEDEP